MSSLNTNFINNTTRTTVNNSEKNLQLGSDGSVTSFEGLSISDAAASNGLNYYRTWSGTNFNETFSFDRTKYNKLTVSGRVYLPGEPSNPTGYGFFIQPCIGSVPYTLSQLNGGFTETWKQPSITNNAVGFAVDQILYNTAGPLANPYLWVFNLEIIISNDHVWSIPSNCSFYTFSGAPATVQAVTRELLPQSWDTILGNQIDTFRILTNIFTSTNLCSGKIGVKISRDMSFSTYT
jgi:hypothetical protein